MEFMVRVLHKDYTHFHHLKDMQKFRLQKVWALTSHLQINFSIVIPCWNGLFRELCSYTLSVHGKQIEISSVFIACFSCELIMNVTILNFHIESDVDWYYFIKLIAIALLLLLIYQITSCSLLVCGYLIMISRWRLI